MPKAAINGFDVHYQQMGQGADVVLLHGLFASLAFWYFSVMPGLAKSFRVTAYDLRGHGYTDIPNAGYTSSDMANDLHALLDHLQIERAHLVGHSFGGAVALQYTLIHPERVHSLTLADAWVPGLQAADPGGQFAALGRTSTRTCGRPERKCRRTCRAWPLVFTKSWRASKNCAKRINSIHGMRC